jgi:hypothetical protein
MSEINSESMRQAIEKLRESRQPFEPVTVVPSHLIYEAALSTEIAFAKAEAAIQRVRDLHNGSVSDAIYCATCNVPRPCPTIIALGELS